MAGIAERAAAPPRVAVCGRRGVGRKTAAHALASAGVAVTASPDAEVVAYIVAEVVKPEDVVAVAALASPAVVVFNKADLAGVTPNGMAEVARARCARLAALAAGRVEPLAGLLAVAAVDDDRLDDALWSALRALADEPGTGSTHVAVVAAADRLPGALRLRLWETLDVPGTARAVAAVRRGATAAAVRHGLRRASGVDGVVNVNAIFAAGAEVRYRRILAAVAELEALAVGHDRVGGQIVEFLASDDVAAARMAAAVEVVDAADGGDTCLDAAAGAAVGWQRYGRGPVSAVHRACGRDIARGSLRRWAATEMPR